jgi:hypothetical protein
MGLARQKARARRIAIKLSSAVSVFGGNDAAEPHGARMRYTTGERPPSTLIAVPVM